MAPLPALAAEDPRRKGYTMLEQGNISGAVDSFASALKHNPDDLNSLLGMGQALRVKKDEKHASIYYRKVLAQHPANRVALTSLIDILNLDPRTRDESISLLRKFVVDHPKDYAAKRRLAYVLSAKPDSFNEALQLLRELHTLRPTDSEILLTLASITNWKPTWRESEQYYKQYLELKPEDYDARLSLASLYSWEKHSKAEASKEYDRLLKEKNDPKVRLAKAMFLAWNGGGTEALVEFEKLRKQTPTLMLDGNINGKPQKVPLVLYEAQVAKNSIHNYDKAESLYTEYLSKKPDDYFARLELANMLCESAKRPDAALKQYDLLLRERPNDTALRVKKIIMLIAQHRSTEVLADLKVLSQQHPTQPIINFWFQGRNRDVAAPLAYERYLDEHGYTDEAKQVLKHYLTMVPNDTLAKHELDDLEGRGLWAALTQADLEKLVKEHPDNLSYKLQTGLFLQSHDEPEQALPYLAEVSEKTPFTEPSYLWIVNGMYKRPAIVAYALCLELCAAQASQRTTEGTPRSTGLVQEDKPVLRPAPKPTDADAISAYQRYLTHAPDDKVVRLQLARLLSKQKDADSKAAALQELTTVIDKDNPVSLSKEDAALQTIALFFRTDVLSQLSRHDEALHELDLMIAKDPMLPQLDGRKGEKLNPTLQKATILIKTGKCTEAELLLNTYLSQPEHQSDLLAHRLRAETLGQQPEKREEALAELEQLLTLYPEDELLVRAKAHLLNQLGRSAQSLLQLQELAKTHQTDPAVTSEMAYALKCMGQIPEANEILNSWLAKASTGYELTDRLAIVCQLGDYLLLSKKYSEAKSLFENQLKILGANDRIYAGLACACAAEKKVDEAKFFAEKSLNLVSRQDLVWRTEQLSSYPVLKPLASANLRRVFESYGGKPQDMLLCLANLELWDKKDQPTGIKHLKQYLENNPNDFNARRNLANAMAWSSHNAESVRIYNDLLKERPDDITLRVELARAEMAGKSTKRNSIDDFQRYLQFRPDDNEARQQLADAYNWTGKPSPAIEIYNNLLKQKPDDHKLLIGLAHAEVSNKSTRQQGLEHAKQYLSFEPGDKDVVQFLASNLSWTRGQEKVALDYYKRLTPESSTDVQLKREYAGLLARTGHVKQALALLNSVLETDPTNRKALLGLADVYRLDGSIMKAETVLKKLRQLYPEDEQTAMLSAYNFRTMGRYDLAVSELHRWQKNAEQSNTD